MSEPPDLPPNIPNTLRGCRAFIREASGRRRPVHDHDWRARGDHLGTSGDDRGAGKNDRGTRPRNGEAPQAAEPFRQRPSQREANHHRSGPGLVAVREQRGVPGRSRRGGGASRSDRPDATRSSGKSRRRSRATNRCPATCGGKSKSSKATLRRTPARRTASERSSATTRPRRWSTSGPSCTCW